MALVMGMMGCVRSWGGRCRRRHSEIANVVSVTGVHMSSDLVEIGRATCKDGCMLMGPVSCSWTLSAAIASVVHLPHEPHEQKPAAAPAWRFQGSTSTSPKLRDRAVLASAVTACQRFRTNAPILNPPHDRVTGLPEQM